METIIDFPNYEIHLCTILDDQPHIWSKKHKKYIKEEIIKNGYKRVHLCGKDGNDKKYLLSRLIAQYFINNPENKLEVDHINKNRIDNRIQNLRWVTSSENNWNKISKGYSKRKYSYQVAIKFNGVNKTKRVKTEEEAINLINEWKIQFHSIGL